MLSSERVVEQADGVMRTIMETYHAPNRSLREVAEVAEASTLDPLHTFSDACRAERRQVVTGTRVLGETRRASQTGDEDASVPRATRQPSR